MATVFVMSDPVSSIDYSITDGRIREFVLNGEVLYDENREVNAENWKEALFAFVLKHGLNLDDSRGLHAFIPKFMEEMCGDWGDV